MTPQTTPQVIALTPLGRTLYGLMIAVALAFWVFLGASYYVALSDGWRIASPTEYVVTGQSMIPPAE